MLTVSGGTTSADSTAVIVDKDGAKTFSFFPKVVADVVTAQTV